MRWNHYWPCRWRHDEHLLCCVPRECPELCTGILPWWYSVRGPDALVPVLIYCGSWFCPFRVLMSKDMLCWRRPRASQFSVIWTLSYDVLQRCAKSQMVPLHRLFIQKTNVTAKQPYYHPLKSTSLCTAKYCPIFLLHI